MKEMIRVGVLIPGDKAAMYIKNSKQYGFESYTLTFWKSAYKYDLKEIAKEVKEAIGDDDIKISAISNFGNPLMDENDVAGYENLIKTAKYFDCDIVSGFAGRLKDRPINESMGKYKEVYTPLAKLAEDNGVRIAFENCNMGGNYNKGDWNIAINPYCWDMMFNTLDAKNIGLEWEPCHQMVQLIDPMPGLRAYVNKIFHVHGKDATIAWDEVKSKGILGSHEFVWHRTPGFGDSNWSDYITVLMQNGFKGAIDIEGYHDPVMREELEFSAQITSLNYLKQQRGGAFVKNFWE